MGLVLVFQKTDLMISKKMPREIPRLHYQIQNLKEYKPSDAIGVDQTFHNN